MTNNFGRHIRVDSSKPLNTRDSITYYRNSNPSLGTVDEIQFYHTPNVLEAKITNDASGLRLQIVPAGDDFIFDWASTVGIIRPFANKHPDLGNSSTAYFGDAFVESIRLMEDKATNPTTLGQFFINGADVFVYSGGAARNLSTAGGAGIGGSGTTNTIPKFTASTTLGNSILSENGGDFLVGGNNTLAFNVLTDAFLTITQGATAFPPQLDIAGFTNTSASRAGGDIRISTGLPGAGGTAGSLTFRNGSDAAVVINTTQFIIDRDIIPGTDSIYDIGSATERFVSVHGENLEVYTAAGVHSGQITSSSTTFDVAAFNANPPFPLKLYGGSATGTNQNGGDIDLRTGVRSGSGVSGAVNFYVGEAGVGKRLVIQPHASGVEISTPSISGTPYNILIYGADGFTSGDAGSSITFRPGAGHTAGADGTVIVRDAADTNNVLRITGRELYIGNGTDELAANSSTPRIGIRRASGDGNGAYLYLKDTSIAHGMTTLIDTDVIALLDVGDGGNGGISITGYTKSAIGIIAYSRVTFSSIAKTTAATAALMIRADKKSGTGVGAMGTDENLFAITNNVLTRFIFDAEGSGHADVEWTTYDDYPDWEIAGAITTLISGQRNYFKSVAEKYRPLIEQAKLVTFNEDGHHFVNFTKLPLFCLDMGFQLGQMAQAQEQRILSLESRLQALEAGK